MKTLQMKTLTVKIQKMKTPKTMKPRNVVAESVKNVKSVDVGRKNVAVMSWKSVHAKGNADTVARIHVVVLV